MTNPPLKALANGKVICDRQRMDGRLRELEIKALLLERLRAHKALNRRGLIASEFAVGRTVRADLVLLAKGELVGVEVKGEFDTLRRLTKQLDIYRAHFDRTILVLASRHLRSTQGMLPPDIEVWELCKAGRLIKMRSGSASTDDKVPLSRLMVRKDIDRFLRPGPEAASRASIRDAFESAFADRYGPTSRAFWDAVGRRRIRPEHVLLLSRFRPRRQAVAKYEATRAAIWDQWAAADQAAR